MNTKKYAFLIVLSIGLLLTTSCTSRTLGIYKNSIKDLLPEQIGEYKKVKEVPAIPAMLVNAQTGLKIIEDGANIYKTNETVLRFGAINFDSSENANKALKLLNLGTPRTQGVKITDASEKKKGSTVIGERFEAETINMRQDGSDVMQESFIYWTNGSVLFLMSSLDNAKFRGLKLTELKGLEDSLPY